MAGNTDECKGCGKQIDAGSSSCPHCGLKIKKPLYKNWWFWLIVAVVVIGGIVKILVFF
jgi:predicted amidophosphoribosyltransferase